VEHLGVQIFLDGCDHALGKGGSIQWGWMIPPVRDTDKAVMHVHQASHKLWMGLPSGGPFKEERFLSR
jgi:hypothetical protein